MNDVHTNMVLIQITTADCSRTLTAIHKAEISIFDVEMIDYFTLQLFIHERNIFEIKKIADKFGGSVSVIKRSRRYYAWNKIRGRPILFLGLFLLFAATLYLPTRVLFIQVEGNATVPTKLILESARSCGVTFGASARHIRSENIKNRLLELLPQLKWAGINTHGSLAVISVTEREDVDSQIETRGVSSIVAARDGVIASCTVTSGNPVCKVGDAVKEGQILVSGYTDCGISILATRSEAEIFAQTKRNIQLLIPTDYGTKGDFTKSVKKYSLIIGKKRINFYNDGGILDTSCDKMYTSYVLTLPGGLELPVVLMVEEHITYNAEPVSTNRIEVSSAAEEAAKSYLLQHMVAGSIMKTRASGSYMDGVYVLDGEYRCMEMIGRLRNEEIMENYGKDNRTDG